MKKLITLIVALGFVTGAQAAFYDSQTSSQPMTAKANLKADAFASKNDQQLNLKIRDSINNDNIGIDATSFKLSTKNGVVTIEGIVNNASDQQALLNTIKKVDGVKEVQSNLKVMK